MGFEQDFHLIVECLSRILIWNSHRTSQVPNLSRGPSIKNVHHGGGGGCSTKRDENRRV